jgi:hypothetical protein
MPFGEQQCGEVAADSTEIAGRSGNEDRAVMWRFHRHIAYLVLAFVTGQDMTGPARQALLDQRRDYRISTVLSRATTARQTSACGCAVRSWTCEAGVRSISRRRRQRLHARPSKRPM